MTRPETESKSSSLVSAMFDEVSPRYDVVNDVLSLGVTRLWRIATTRAIAPRKGMRVLDLAAGTGTSSAAFAAGGASVTAADFSEGMLAEGRKRHADNDRIEFVWADATALPFADNSFDATTISYGLRNVDRPRLALAEMFRVTKPGGRIVIAEFSRPPAAVVRAPYFGYTKHVMPHIAGLINGSSEAYSYLNESIQEWPDQPTLAEWLREAGFERVAYRNLTFGIVALHRGFVPADKASTPAALTPEELAAAAPQPAAPQPAAPQPAAPQPAEPKPAEPKQPAAKPAAPKKAAPAKPAAAKKPAAKPAAPKPATTAKPAAAKKPAAKPSETPKPAAKPSETPKPAAKPSETKKPAATPSQARPKPPTKKAEQ